MKNAVYSVFDRAISAFSSPMMAQNEVMMRRSLIDLFVFEAHKPEMEQHQFVRYADSFDVYLIGEFETDNGVLSCFQPTMIFRMAEFKGQ